ncbi:ABC transporter substrate-binding protein [Schlesneria sp. DSM 10557]|uniref:ABC transporter substrate-binding protein n=1 Tax=Schlesneria sp. DSM 10557 TaxID=3044399 RepID=UPI0035A0C1A1
MSLQHSGPAGTRYTKRQHAIGTPVIRCVAYVLFVALSLPGSDAALCRGAEDKKPSTPAPTVAPDQQAEPGTADSLPLYTDMELPAAEDLLRSKPFDWIVLKSNEVLIVEPVPLRPDTLASMNLEYERHLKGRAGFREGNDRLGERRRSFQSLPITLLEPGEEQDPDYLLETKVILKIDYFEDLVLRRASLLIDERNVPLAYDLLLLVDRRHRENNVRLKEAYQAMRREEAEIAAGDERERFTLPDPPPLKLSATWPKFDELYQKLLMTDAELRNQQGDREGAVRLLEDLWDRNSSYPELSLRLGQVIDLLINELGDQERYREARYFLKRLTAREAQHPIALKWKAELISRTTAMMEEARRASAEGNTGVGARLVDQAARIWPETPGLREAHRELTERHQIIRLGVLRLPGEATSYPYPTASDTLATSLTAQPLFEPTRVDERGVRYRSQIVEAWEPQDLGRQVQFTVRLRRADWEARPLITSFDIVDELSRKLDPQSPLFDARLAGAIVKAVPQSPSQFTVHFRRLPLRLESLLQFPVSLADPQALNPDLFAGALPSAGRQRFFETERDARSVTYRRVRPQPATLKARHVEEVVHVRYDNWERALQGLMRGEITGIPFADLQDVRVLQDDNRFLVTPYALPISHMIMFNPSTPVLRDAQLRRAMSLAIPRSQLIEQSILAGVNARLARLTATPFPTVSYGHNRLLEGPPYDPQRAAALVLTAKKQLGGSELPVLRIAAPPDSRIRASVQSMIEHWRRVGLSVQLNESTVAATHDDYDLIYRTERVIEPLIDLWPLLTQHSDTRVDALRPLPERVRRQLLELERVNDWTSATGLLHRIEAELLIETRFIPLWEVDEYFVTRRNLNGQPARLMHPFQDVERWTLQSWYPQDTP